MSGIFSKYFSRVLQQEPEAQYEKEKIPFKIPVVLHSASDHPPNVFDLSVNIKVLFLQMMAQAVRANFKANYLYRTFSRPSRHVLQVTSTSKNSGTSLISIQ
jgi:hypothetical protein